MNIPCPDRVDCGTGPSVNGFDWPITNYSSEDPDRPVYIAIKWADGPPPIDGPPPPPPPVGCFVIATSTDSIQTAQYCAIRANILCDNGDVVSADQQVDCDINNRVNPPDGDDNIVGPRLYGNTEQTCTVSCLDGTRFSYTVRAGTFLSTSQTDANRQAYSAACRQAELARQCSGTGSNPVCPHMICFGEDFEFQLGDGSLVDYEIVAGTLPPGIDMNSSGLISGTAGNSPGEYTATIQVSTGIGVNIQYTFWTRVWGFTNPETLGGGRIGFAYNEQLVAAGYLPGSTPDFGTVHNFGLPDGITLNSDGSFTGTPTAAGTYRFAAWVADGCSGYCEKVFEITVYEVANEKITSVVCPSNPAISVPLNPPIAVGAFNGPAGTSQVYLDARAQSAAIAQSQSAMAASGCACYITDYNNSVNTHYGLVYTSCLVEFDGYGYAGGVISPVAAPYFLDLFIGPAGADLDFIFDTFSGLDPTIWTLDFAFIPSDLPATLENVAFFWHHQAHP